MGRHEHGHGAMGMLARHRHTSPEMMLLIGVVLAGVAAVMAVRMLLGWRPVGWRWMGGTRMSRLGAFAWTVVTPALWGAMFLDGFFRFLSRLEYLWFLGGSFAALIGAGIFDTIRERRSQGRRQAAHPDDAASRAEAPERGRR